MALAEYLHRGIALILIGVVAGCVSVVVPEAQQEYTIEVVNRPGEMSGVWRTKNEDPSYRKYYLIVEAIGSKGEILKRPITNHETGEKEKVHKWGLEVAPELYEKYKADKLDDGVIQGRVVGIKEQGAVETKYYIPTTGMAITRW